MYVLQLLIIIIIIIISISRIPAWIGRWGQRPHTLHFLCNAPKLLCTPEICVWAAHQNSGPIKCILCCRVGCLNANFSGEHRVVSFLQLSEISFTRDTHGAVAHMAGENIVRSCKGQHPIQNFFASICICKSEKQGMLLVVICSRCLYHNLHVYLYFWLYLQIQRMVGSCTRLTPETFCAAQKLLCAPFSLFWRLFSKKHSMIWHWAKSF